MHFFTLHSTVERCGSGLSGRSRKPLWLRSPWVRIPPSPPVPRCSVCCRCAAHTFPFLPAQEGLSHTSKSTLKMLRSITSRTHGHPPCLQPRRGCWSASSQSFGIECIVPQRGYLSKAGFPFFPYYHRRVAVARLAQEASPPKIAAAAGGNLRQDLG